MNIIGRSFAPSRRRPDPDPYRRPPAKKPRAADRAGLRGGGDVLGSVFRAIFGGGGGLLQVAGEPHDGGIFRGDAVRAHLLRPRVVRREHGSGSGRPEWLAGWLLRAGSSPLRMRGGVRGRAHRSHLIGRSG